MASRVNKSQMSITISDCFKKMHSFRKSEIIAVQMGFSDRSKFSGELRRRSILVILKSGNEFTLHIDTDKSAEIYAELVNAITDGGK